MKNILVYILLFLLLIFGYTVLVIHKTEPQTGDIINLGADELVEVPIIKEKVGEEYALYYKNNETSKKEKFIVTKEEYEDVITNNKQPSKKGYTYLGGYGGKELIATSTPILKDNQYYVLSGKEASGTLMIVVKLPDKEITTINKANINDLTK